MAVFSHIELDEKTGRHRLVLINQQADYLAVIAYDAERGDYVYVPWMEWEISAEQKAQALQRARAELPARDREQLFP